jgi:hypothetical protein
VRFNQRFVDVWDAISLKECSNAFLGMALYFFSSGRNAVLAVSFRRGKSETRSSSKPMPVNTTAWDRGERKRGIRVSKIPPPIPAFDQFTP